MRDIKARIRKIEKKLERPIVFDVKQQRGYPPMRYILPYVIGRKVEDILQHLVSLESTKLKDIAKVLN